jgi:hypothetical protein
MNSLYELLLLKEAPRYQFLIECYQDLHRTEALYLFDSADIEGQTQMVEVKKRDGSVEDFMESKILAACEKAGSTAEQAAYVVLDVVEKIGDAALISTEELSELVESSLRKVNEGAADAFLKYKEEKYRPDAAD